MREVSTGDLDTDRQQADTHRHTCMHAHKHTQACAHTHRYTPTHTPLVVRGTELGATPTLSKCSLTFALNRSIGKLIEKTVEFLTALDR